MRDMTNKKCGLQQCLKVGSLQCATCRYIGYCSKECQKVDWKRRHKRECSSLYEIVRTHYGHKCDYLLGFQNFYAQSDETEFLDRWLEATVELISLLDEKVISAADNLDSGQLSISYYSTYACRNILNRLPTAHHLVSTETMESFVSRAAAAFDSAEAILGVIDAADISVDSDWPNVIHCGRTLSLFVQAECLERRGRLVEAVAMCKKAIASAESLTDSVSYTYRFATFLMNNNQHEDAREVFKKVYCIISEKQGPGDVYLQSVVADLATVSKALGDLEEAEYYSRSALDTLRAQGGSSCRSGMSEKCLCRALIVVADVLHQKMKTRRSVLVEEEGKQLEWTSSDLATCREAESLYREAITMLDANKAEDQIVDTFRPIFGLNELISQREIADDDTDHYYKREIAAFKEGAQFPLFMIAKRMLPLLKFHCHNLIKSESARTCDHSLLDDASFMEAFATAKYATLEAIATAAAACVTGSTDNAFPDFDYNEMQEQSSSTNTMILSNLSVVADRYLRAVLHSTQVDYRNCSRRDFDGGDASNATETGRGVDASELAAPTTDILSDWFIIPDGLIQSCLMWMAPYNISLESSSSGRSMSGYSGTDIEGKRKQDSRRNRRKPSRHRHSHHGSSSNGATGSCNRGNNSTTSFDLAAVEGSVSDWLQHLLEASLLLSMGEAVAGMYFNSIKHDPSYYGLIVGLGNKDEDKAANEDEDGGHSDAESDSDDNEDDDDEVDTDVEDIKDKDTNGGDHPYPPIDRCDDDEGGESEVPSSNEVILTEEESGSRMRTRSGGSNPETEHSTNAKENVAVAVELEVEVEVEAGREEREAVVMNATANEEAEVVAEVKSEAACDTESEMDFEARKEAVQALMRRPDVIEEGDRLMHVFSGIRGISSVRRNKLLSKERASAAVKINRTIHDYHATGGTGTIPVANSGTMVNDKTSTRTTNTSTTTGTSTETESSTAVPLGCHLFAEKAQLLLLQAMDMLELESDRNSSFGKTFISRIQFTVESKLRGAVQPGFMEAVNHNRS